MKISNQRQNNTYISAPSFAANHRKWVNEVGTDILNSTAFFRYDLNFDKFAQTLIDKYKGMEKVHIYNYACSDGAEPFSLAMMLIKKLGKKGAEKFFPIMASDIDEKILENPKRGIVKLSEPEIDLMKERFGNDYLNFIQHDRQFKLDENLQDKVCNGRIKPILRDTVIFEKKNIVEDIKNVERENSVVICRNFFPYLSKPDRCNLAQNLYDYLGNNSMCVIGEYDNGHQIGSKLLNKGFVDSLGNTFDKNPQGILDLFYFKPPAKAEDALINPDYLKSVYIKNSAIS